MNKYFYILLFSLICFKSNIAFAKSFSDAELIKLVQFATENNDMELLKDSINALMEGRREQETVSVLTKYSEAGKLDYALHNAIKSGDLSAAFILGYYSKNLNKRTDWEVVWTNISGKNKSGNSREGKNPLELALWNGMDSLIPFLISRGSDIYQMRSFSFVFENEENLEFINEIFPDAIVRRQLCAETKKPIIATGNTVQRSFIGDLIALNRLDLIEIIGKKPVNWNAPCLQFKEHHNLITYTPLQYALLLKRNDLTLYFLTYGATIDCGN